MVSACGRAIFLAAAFLLLLLIPGACGTRSEEQVENRYSAATWSPAGDQVAYFRTQVAYTRVSPRVSLLVGQDSTHDTYHQAFIFLCVNDAAGSGERVLDQIVPPSPEEGAAVYTNIEWRDGQIRYGAAVQGGFSTGVLEVAPSGGGRRQVATSYEAIVALQPRPVNARDQELYAGPGDYGFFAYDTIYLFDHQQRQVSVYLHDPLSGEAPFVPPYDVSHR